MNRTTNRVQVAQDLTGGGRVRWVTTVEDDLTDEGTPQALARQHQFLQQLVDNPALLLCGPARFERLSIWHNGKCWMAQAQAHVDEQTSL